MPNAKLHSANIFKGLFRSTTNKIIAGVCGGLGEFFEIDPTIVRVVFILITVFGGSGILIYLILWLIIPKHISASEPKENLKAGAQEIRQAAQNFASQIRLKGNQNSRQWLGIMILIFGLIFLLQNFGFYDYINFNRLWPIFLIVIGLLILFKR